MCDNMCMHSGVCKSVCDHVRDVGVRTGGGVSQDVVQVSWACVSRGRQFVCLNQKLDVWRSGEPRHGRDLDPGCVFGCCGFCCTRIDSGFKQVSSAVCCKLHYKEPKLIFYVLINHDWLVWLTLLSFPPLLGHCFWSLVQRCCMLGHPLPWLSLLLQASLARWRLNWQMVTPE